jgi:hypothetical protein
MQLMLWNASRAIRIVSDTRDLALWVAGLVAEIVLVI